MPRRRKTPRETEEANRAEASASGEAPVAVPGPAPRGTSPAPVPGPRPSAPPAALPQQPQVQQQQQQNPQPQLPAGPTATAPVARPPVQHVGPPQHYGGQGHDEAGSSGPAGRGRGMAVQGRGRGRGRQYNAPNYPQPGSFTGEPYRAQGPDFPEIHQQQQQGYGAPMYGRPSRPTQPTMMTPNRPPQAGGRGPPPVQSYSSGSGPPVQIPASVAGYAQTTVVEQFGTLSVGPSASIVPAAAPIHGHSPPPQPLIPVSSKALRFPLRPGMGRTGTKCMVKANHFYAELPDKDLHQYDVCAHLLSVFVCRSLSMDLSAAFATNSVPFLD